MLLCRLLKEEEGQTLVEYGLLVALIALVVIAALTVLGRKELPTPSTKSTKPFRKSRFGKYPFSFAPTDTVSQCDDFGGLTAQSWEFRSGCPARPRERCGGSERCKCARCRARQIL